MEGYVIDFKNATTFKRITPKDIFEVNFFNVSKWVLPVYWDVTAVVNKMHVVATREGGGGVLGSFSYGYVPTWCSNLTLSKIFRNTKILPCLKYQH